ncbi:hypothetical protein AAFF_G00380580 [Aldrovandia affinis]|uniref:PB1 domain-containing protein n=1 Tax=Aldrovandia affinis TaxID=143900 RepID=A0AAD7X009_9TELE|nr:hypothetical protein AAFF_G00380580 [Aldrovandia affinis]
MDLHVNLKVNFRGNAASFLVSDWERTNWETVEAMMKSSFGLCNLQVKYLDEDNEEVSINSQEEYQEALKSAMKQGNQLQMNVYKMKGPVDRGPMKTEAKELKNGIRPCPLYPSIVKTVDQETQVTPAEPDMVIIKEVKGTKQHDQTPPAWFTSYMEKFKDQVVKDTVEKLCRPLHVAQSRLLHVSVQQMSQTCFRGGYWCSVCPSCTLCELCSFSHDPGHSLVRMPPSTPEYGASGERSRFHSRGDRSFRKAEKQRVKAEKRQLKAEVKEIRKQLRMERRGLQRSAASNGSLHPIPLQPCSAWPSSPESPTVCPTMMPTMTALFLDENLPDGTCLEPGTKFIKCWKMRNVGTVSWTAETKLKFMWGNLALVSGQKQKEVAAPFLQPGQEGVVSVAFVTPTLEGTYTSHWRLAHRGEQFGPRVWCSIVVDPAAPPRTEPQEEEPHSPEEGRTCCSGSRSCALMSAGHDREFFVPSVDLLTAQDLLSFELLDVNIVQELERVPHNTPVDMTPCMSPLPHDATLQEKAGLGLIEEEAEASGVKNLLGVLEEPPSILALEEGEEDISGTQFVCETVIRSLTLEEAPDHRPLRRSWPCSNKVNVPRVQDPCFLGRAGDDQGRRRLGPAVESGATEAPSQASLPTPSRTIRGDLAIPEECAELDIERVGEDASGRHEEEEDGEEDEVLSQGSSESSEDYIVILPDCFDTSRPLGESMYSSALSQAPGRATPKDERRDPAPAGPGRGSVNDMLCASQTLDTVPLTPEVVPAPAPAPPQPSPPATNRTARSEAPCAMELAAEALTINEPAQPGRHVAGFSPVRSQGPARNSEACDSQPRTSQDLRAHGGITGGLVKGALSVAASAYKALFTGQPGPAQPPVDVARQEATMMPVLLEMGFGNRQLNQRLLRKHSYNLLDVVNELVQMTDVSPVACSDPSYRLKFAPLAMDRSRCSTAASTLSRHLRDNVVLVNKIYILRSAEIPASYPRLPALPLK